MNYPTASSGVSKTARNEAGFGECDPEGFKSLFVCTSLSRSSAFTRSLMRFRWYQKKTIIQASLVDLGTKPKNSLTANYHCQGAYGYKIILN
ncbi:MAG: hypothetical protein WCW53_09930 [Syntrophales bacterium]|jgi:hypothetical protein